MDSQDARSAATERELIVARSQVAYLEQKLAEAQEQVTSLNLQLGSATARLYELERSA